MSWRRKCGARCERVKGADATPARNAGPEAGAARQEARATSRLTVR